MAYVQRLKNDEDFAVKVDSINSVEGRIEFINAEGYSISFNDAHIFKRTLTDTAQYNSWLVACTSVNPDLDREDWFSLYGKDL